MNAERLFLLINIKMRGHMTRRVNKGKKRSGTKRHQRGGAVPRQVISKLFVAARKLEQKAARMVKAVNDKEPLATEDAIAVSSGIVSLINNHILPLMKVSNVPIGHRYQEGVDKVRK